MINFTVRMTNQLQFSSCSAPHRPTTKKQIESLAVTLCGELLTMTQVRENGDLGSRIYAQRTLALPGASTFMLLPQLPSNIVDGSFFPALGTAAVFHTAAGEKRRLRAVGTDVNSGFCRGWIFDAMEE